MLRNYLDIILSFERYLSVLWSDKNCFFLVWTGEQAHCPPEVKR